jgi:hypothetical protein
MDLAVPKNRFGEISYMLKELRNVEVLDMSVPR